MSVDYTGLREGQASQHCEPSLILCVLNSTNVVKCLQPLKLVRQACSGMEVQILCACCHVCNVRLHNCEHANMLELSVPCEHVESSYTTSPTCHTHVAVSML